MTGTSLANRESISYIFFTQSLPHQWTHRGALEEEKYHYYDRSFPSCQNM